MINYEEFGDRFKDFRIEKNLTLEETAEATGISKSTLSKIENGFLDTRFTNIVKLAEFYNVSVDYLLGLKRSKRVMQSEMSELGLSDKAIMKLKEKKRNAKTLSKLILADGTDELLNRIEIFLNGELESTYSILNSVYDTVLYGIRKENGEELSDDAVLNILRQSHYDDSYDRFKIREALDELLVELKEKYGKTPEKNNSVNAPVNAMSRDYQEMLKGEHDFKPAVRDLFFDFIDGGCSEDEADMLRKSEQLDAVFGAVDAVIHTQDVKLNDPVKK